MMKEIQEQLNEYIKNKYPGFELIPSGDIAEVVNIVQFSLIPILVEKNIPANITIAGLLIYVINQLTLSKQDLDMVWKAAKESYPNFRFEEVEELPIQSEEK